MTPAQFLARMKKREIAPAYLFLGAESYQRRICREALLSAALGDANREDALTRHDLRASALAEVIDDARSLSLFASERVILAAGAEAALPKGRAAEDSEEEPSAGQGDLLEAYLRDPSPGVVLVFDCDRYDFEGEDKTKLDRVRKFYRTVTDTLELRRYAAEDARAEAEKLAQRAGLAMEPAAMELLIESLAADMARIAVEIEKLALYAGSGRPITTDDIAALVPDARATTIFALVNALGRRDRARSLAVLDTLAKEGEYLPLALAFLSGQFRMALAAKEAGLRSPQQIQAHFSRSGVPMWGSRAEQIYQTVSKFSAEQLTRGMTLVFEADKGLRSPRPDDRIVMERFVLELTA
jgi:DNA polymerase III subunit delta